jgi:hypothetical protein
LFDNGFKINNYKTRNGVTTFVIRSYTAPGFAKLTAKYPVNAPVVEKTIEEIAQEPARVFTIEEDGSFTVGDVVPEVVIDRNHPDHPDFSDAEDRAAETRWMEQHPVADPAEFRVNGLNREEWYEAFHSTEQVINGLTPHQLREFFVRMNQWEIVCDTFRIFFPDNMAAWFEDNFDCLECNGFDVLCVLGISEFDHDYVAPGSLLDLVEAIACD